jgi:hypothetical protein
LPLRGRRMGGAEQKAKEIYPPSIIQAYTLVSRYISGDAVASSWM